MFSNIITTIYSSQVLLFKTTALNEKIKITIYYYNILNGSVSLLVSE